MQTNNNIFRLVAFAMLGTVSYLLMFFDFPLPGFPPFLKIDFSEIPVLFGAIIFGPVGGIVIEAIKNLLHYVTQPGPAGVPIGELANFAAGLLFVLPVAFIARKVRSKKGIVIGLSIGVVLMAHIMSVLNYFVILPAYMWFTGFQHLSADAMFKLVAAGIMPFNLIKGAVTAVIFLILYPKLQPMIQRFTTRRFGSA
ncbi:MAG TPA: ECF transporter S component [Bacillales bacterium]|nr:ECF transporter S component [Bacillales bacterium]